MSERGDGKNNEEPGVLLPKTEQDFRLEQSQKVVEFLERTHAYDYAKSVMSGEEEPPSFEDFESFLVRLNGIARDIPISKRKIDGEHVYLSGMLGDSTVPRPEDKEGILRYAFDSVKDIDKKDVKYMLPAVINAVHLFADGNGRTSRLMHILFRDFPSQKDCLAEVERALTVDGRLDSFDVSPVLADTFQVVLKNHGWSEGGDGQKKGFGFRLGSAEIAGLKDKICPEAKEFFKLYRDSAHFALAAVKMVFKDDKIKRFFTDKYGKDRFLDIISPIKMAEILKDEDWQALVDNYYQLKKEEASALVDIFKEPNEYKSPNGKTTLRDEFVKNIEKKGKFI